jgi:mevalonate kinase
VDNTASTYGGLLRFWLENGKQNFERIKTPQPFEIVLCNSGITANTAALDEFIEAQKKNNATLFRSRLDTIIAQGAEMKKALEAGDHANVGRLMTENYKLLVEMDMSHEILDHLCKVALENGALGAKVTGGGRGGYMLSLTPGKDLQDKVAAAFEKAGYTLIIKATIGGS